MQSYLSIDSSSLGIVIFVSPYSFYIFDMFSDQQIRSMVRMQTAQQDCQTQNMLDLSHQQLRRLKQIQLKQLNVERVNASYNYFKDFNHLNFKEVNQRQEIPVKWLDLSFNFFTRIDESAESAHVLQYLKYLNISANRLESVDFSQLTVPLLEILNLNNNQIQFFLDAPPNLRVLTLDHNHLTSLAFSGGDNLSVLSAMDNKIKTIGVKLSNLLLFDLQSNLIDDLQIIKEFVTHSKQLLSINLRQNPVSSINTYKVMLLERCDNITEIDDVAISPHIRQGFKILKSEERLDEMLDQANKRYVDRLSQKQKIKQELIKKMKEQESLIEERFHSGIKEERDQFQVLEKQAKIILGKNKLNVRTEKDQFNKKLGEYSHQREDLEQVSQEKISIIQNQHLKEYLEYLKKRPVHPKSSQSKQRRRKEENLASTDIREEFQHLILYDPKCVETLLKGYQVNMIEM